MLLLAVGICLLVLYFAKFEVTSEDCPNCHPLDPANADPSVIAAYAGLISAIAGLVTAITGLVVVIRSNTRVPKGSGTRRRSS